jgi:uncharacterized protein YdaU (DUF1376 family)
MSNPPWMPLNIADYLRDTTHLDAEESGCYLHLIMGYWVAGKLPNDNRQLAAIAKVSERKWRRIRRIIGPFFGPGFSSHKRIDRELQRAAAVREKARQAARQRWAKHGRNGHANASLGHMQYTK